MGINNITVCTVFECCSLIIIQWVSAGGMCENSAVEACHGCPGDKILDTQIINKSLPAPDDYPVRIFVNITYSFMSSYPGRIGCDDDFELQVGNMKDGEMSYSDNGIMPDHRIQDTTLSGTQHFYFDSSQGEDNFVLRLKDPPRGVLIFIVLILLGAPRNVSAMLGGDVDTNVVGLMLISEMIVNHA